MERDAQDEIRGESISNRKQEAFYALLQFMFVYDDLLDRSTGDLAHNESGLEDLLHKSIQLSNLHLSDFSSPMPLLLIHPITSLMPLSLFLFPPSFLKRDRGLSPQNHLQTEIVNQPTGPREHGPPKHNKQSPD